MGARLAPEAPLKAPIRPTRMRTTHLSSSHGQSMAVIYILDDRTSTLVPDTLLTRGCGDDSTSGDHGDGNGEDKGESEGEEAAGEEGSAGSSLTVDRVICFIEYGGRENKLTF